MVSCKLYRLDTKAALKSLSPLLERLKKEKSLTYGHIRDDQRKALKLYFDHAEENEFGEWYDFFVDKELVLWSREEGDYTVGVTFSASVQFFGGDLSPLVAVFSGRYNAVIFEDAVHSLCGPEATIFLPVELDLTGKSEEIRGHFADVQRFKVERLRDDKEKLASIGGMKLQSSTAWTRYLDKMKGALTMVVVKFRDTYIKILEDGMLRFRAQSDDVRMVRDVVNELRSLGIMN